jgi:hypothetical protein
MTTLEMYLEMIFQKDNKDFTKNFKYSAKLETIERHLFGDYLYILSEKVENKVPYKYKWKKAKSRKDSDKYNQYRIIVDSATGEPVVRYEWATSIFESDIPKEQFFKEIKDFVQEEKIKLKRLMDTMFPKY